MAIVAGPFSPGLYYQPWQKGALPTASSGNNSPWSLVPGGVPSVSARNTTRDKSISPGWCYEPRLKVVSARNISRD
jgi:hypothetical protein